MIELAKNVMILVHGETNVIETQDFLQGMYYTLLELYNRNLIHKDLFIELEDFMKYFGH